MKVILFVLLFVILFVQSIYAVQPPTAELNCVLAIISKFAFTLVTNLNDICSSSYITCAPTTNYVTRFTLQVFASNGAIASPTDFSCLPNLTFLQISNQIVSKDLLYYKLPLVTQVNYNNVKFTGGVTLDQPFPAYDTLSIISTDINPSSLLKFSYLNGITTFTLSGSYVTTEVDEAALKSQLYSLKLSTKNYPDLTGYTLSMLDFEIDNTFQIGSIGNFSKIQSSSIRIYSKGPVPQTPFYLHDNEHAYQFSIYGAAGVNMFTTPQSLINITSTKYPSITLDKIGTNFNFNGQLPFLTERSGITFTNNGLSYVPSHMKSSRLVLYDNQIDGGLPIKTGSFGLLDLTNNKVTGTIDDSYCQTELIVTNNQMYGVLPSCMQCFLNAPISVTLLNYPIPYYDRFIGNKFTNLNKTSALNCASFAPRISVASLSSLFVTGIDIGLDVLSWYFNGIKTSGYYVGLKTGAPNHYNYSVSVPSTQFKGDSFTANFFYPSSRIFTFPVVPKAPLVMSVVISGNQLTLSGAFFSSHSKHLEQTILVDSIECNVISTDFYSVVCNTSPITLPNDASLKTLSVTTGPLTGKVTIRTDSTVNNMVCPSNCTSNSQGICDLSTGVCACASGYMYANCAAKTCPDLSCSGHGNCNVMTGKCTCTNSYMGEICQYPPGAPICPNACSGFGVCNANSTCTCDANHQGSDCSIPYVKCKVTLVNSYCNNNGICETTNGTCTCFDGYQGELCNYPKYICPLGPNSKQCNSVGICDTTTGTCTCNPGLQGSDCSIPLISCPIASNGQVCGGAKNWCNSVTGACTCDDNHVGIDCGVALYQCPNVTGKICNNQGTCDTTTGTCTCTNPNYQGPSCSTPFIQCPSTGNGICNNQGTCNNVTGSCDCNTNFQDSLCSTPFIQCPIGSGSLVCSGSTGGNCNNQTGVCLCETYRLFEDCSGILCKNECLNDGICDTSIGQCKCLSGKWTGLNCTTTIHYITSVNASTVNGGEATFIGEFGNTHSDIILTIGGLNCPITSNTSTEITCNAPAGNGIHSVTLIQNGVTFIGNNIYKYVNVNADLVCPSNCLGNGICNTTTGHCECKDSNYGSFDCSPINNGDTDGVPLPPNNSTIDIGNGGSNIGNEKTNFEIYFRSLIEVDFNNVPVTKYKLQNKWLLENGIVNTNIHTLYQKLDNGCMITSKIQEITDSNGKEFEFAGTSFKVENGGIKFTISISNYSFSSNLNTLQIEFISSVDQNKFGSDQEEDKDHDCNSKDTEINTSNINMDSKSNFNYIKISKNNKILSGRFINKLVADGRSTYFSSKVTNESDSLIVVTLQLPHANQISIDPDFSVLMSSEFKSECDDSVDKRKSYVIPVAVVVSFVGLCAIGASSFYVYKKKKESQLNNRLQGFKNRNQ